MHTGFIGWAGHDLLEPFTLAMEHVALSAAHMRRFAMLAPSAFCGVLLRK